MMIRRYDPRRQCVVVIEDEGHFSSYKLRFIQPSSN